MKEYVFSARTREGAIKRGTKKARSRTELVELLQGQGLIVVDVHESLGFGLSSLQKINLGGVPLKEKVIFFRQLATMVASALPILQSLEILHKQISNPRFASVISDVISDIEGGSSLSDSFRKFPDVFDKVTVSLIAAGEESGSLDIILEKLATELEKKQKLKSKVRSAMIYPVIVLVVVIVVIILLLVVLVPAIDQIFEDVGATSQLPFATRFLVNASGFVQKYGIFMIISVGLGYMLFRYHYSKPSGRYFYHRMILKIPQIGTLITKMQVAQFTRVFALLMNSGVNITKALDLTANALTNEVFKETIIKAKEEVSKGMPLSMHIARAEHYPLIVSQMIAVGEESGEMVAVMEKIAEYFNQEVDTMTNNMSSIIEPFMLVFMGIIIAFVAMAVYMPMFSLTNALE